MAFALFVIAMQAGIGADFVRIPLPKKLALTVALIVVPSLVTTTRKRTSRIGFFFAALLAFWSMLSLFVMWFWN
jgi:hypothetical protein